MITMSKSDYEIILKHARENLPEEACGLVAGKKEGKDKFIEKVYCLTNIDHSNEHFSLDPKEQLAAVKDMRANGLAVKGIIFNHFHPGDRMEEDNVAMCKARTGLPVLALVQDDMDRFPMDGQALAELYDEVK